MGMHSTYGFGVPVPSGLLASLGSTYMGLFSLMLLDNRGQIRHCEAVWDQFSAIQDSGAESALSCISELFPPI